MLTIFHKYRLLNADKDWSDYLNPVLIKELRQGLRSHLFVWSLIISQLLLMICSLMAVQFRENPEGQMTAQFWFWGGLSLFMLVVMPFWGLHSVEVEFRDNTFEIFYFTALPPSRILWGKWFALVLQLTLLITTLLPHLLIRYLIGASELPTDLSALYFMLATSIPLIAGGIWLSSFNGFITKAFLSLAYLMLWSAFLLFYSIVIGISLSFFVPFPEFLFALAYTLASITITRTALAPAGKERRI